MSKHNLTLHHASLIVADTEASLKFYRDIIGLQPIERPELGFPGAWLAVGSQQIHLLELPNPDPTSGRPEHGGRDRHVAMHVDSIAALRETLENAGVAYTSSISGRKALFCRDRDGNALEFIERPG
ncbi:MAG: VOC family protein [Methylomonas sp.]|jgi:glyoxylase I family protein